jgi:hypothetical protein
MSVIDYSTPVLLQHGEDDESSDDDGMLCKLDLHCFYELSSKLILSSLCVCFTCIDRVLQQCCTLTFIIYICIIIDCHEKNALLWLSVHMEKFSLLIPKQWTCYNYFIIIRSISFQGSVKLWLCESNKLLLCLCDFTFKSFAISSDMVVIPNCIRHYLQIFLILRRQGEIDDNQVP